MIVRLLVLSIIIKYLYIKLNISQFINPNINNYPIIIDYSSYNLYIKKKMKKRIIDDLFIIKENFYIIGKMNTCYFRKIGIEKYEKVYLLDECQEKINDIKLHLNYFSISEIIKILDISIEDYNKYIKFKLKETKEYNSGLINNNNQIQ